MDGANEFMTMCNHLLKDSNVVITSVEEEDGTHWTDHFIEYHEKGKAPLNIGQIYFKDKDTAVFMVMGTPTEVHLGYPDDLTKILEHIKSSVQDEAKLEFVRRMSIIGEEASKLVLSLKGGPITAKVAKKAFKAGEQMALKQKKSKRKKK